MLIEMGGFSVTFQRKRVKNINLRVRRTGEVQLSAPLRMPLNLIHGFLHDKHSWIEVQRQRLMQLEQDVPLHLIDGIYVNFQGRRCLLQVHETRSPRIEWQGDNQLHLFIKTGASEAQKKTVLLKWYKKQMEQLLPSLFEKWQSIMGVTVLKVGIKSMKSRWGSCHPIKKHITLNLRLIEKPLICLEYVIVHELVHLFEASHNHRFYALMDYYLPLWKKIRQELRRE